MDLRVLKTFELVASFMSFNRAAAIQHITQSTVSAQIKSLEEDLGTAVFERLGRRIALTPAGEELMRHVRRLLNYEQDLRAAVRKVGEVVGLISLRVPQSVADIHLPSILQRFCATHPRVGFDISDCGTFHLAEELRSGEIDAGFLLSMPFEAADLCNTVVLSEALAYVACQTSELAGRTKLTIQDLANQRLLLPKHDCAYRMKLQQELAEARIETAAVVELNSVRAIIQCARAGVGVALLPERAVIEELNARRLTKLQWHEPLTADLFLIQHRDKPRVGAYAAFLDVVEQYFAELRESVVALLAPFRQNQPTPH